VVIKKAHCFLVKNQSAFAQKIHFMVCFSNVGEYFAASVPKKISRKDRLFFDKGCTEKLKY